MERRAIAIHRLAGALLPLVLQLAPANFLRRVLHRAQPFQDEAAEPEVEVEVVQMVVEPPEPAEVEADIPAIENIPAPHGPLMGSLYGILNQQGP